jgi:CRISPR-associated protein Cas5d
VEKEAGTFWIRLKGPRARWTVPHFRADPYTYDVPTPSGLKGIIRSIYWKPEIEWEIEEIRVLSPIRKENNMSKAIKNGGYAVDSDRGLQLCTDLLDVDYAVKIRLMVNLARTHRIENPVTKYQSEAYKRFSRGECFRALSFGIQEFSASYELIKDETEIPESIDDSRELGSMLFDLLPTDYHSDEREPVFYRPQMVKGRILVSREIYDEIRPQIMGVRNTYPQKDPKGGEL